jgi:hypothetical protein
MNTKYQKYINYIVNDVEAPYFINMKEMYGLRTDEYNLVLPKLYNQPVTIMGNRVFDKDNNEIYVEHNNGDWYKKEYDDQGNQIYYGDSTGYWVKKEYDVQGNKIYHEDITGFWVKYEYDNQGNEIYSEDNNGYIIDNR